MELPDGFPPMAFPGDNHYTRDRWELGKKLFYEPLLSLDGKVSCSSCHHPQFAFSDTTSVSKGSEGVLGSRNAPSLSNVGYHPYFLREGGVPTLEMQTLVPIDEHAEFNNNIVKITEKLSTIETYREMALKAYGNEINPFVITRAIANFERSLLSGTSTYDLFIQNKEAKNMTSDARKGMELFFSQKTNCNACHSGFNFTNYTFQNNGLYVDYKDVGRQRLTGKQEDQALFKVPSLRNISVTAPYMHDGSIKTLEEVVEHYNMGGQAHPHRSTMIRPLGLTSHEKRQLVAFLLSLEDTYFNYNPIFRQI
ncbi:MAG: cytochrome c peroxidase [Saprospiraceae bacterium]